MANDKDKESCSQQRRTAGSSESEDQPRVTTIDPGAATGLGSRRCYSMVQLSEIAKRPLSKVCPLPLDLEKATSSGTNWLLKIIPGPHQDQPSSGNDRPPLITAEERARSLRSQDTTDLGLKFIPQRISFADGCRTSNALSPQKKTIAVLSTNKENVARDSLEAFGDRIRLQDNGGSGGGVMRGGSREFTNSRHHQSSNNSRYAGYNTERDRYNSGSSSNSNTGGRSYNNDRGGSTGGLQRNFNNNLQNDDRGYDRGGGYSRSYRDQDRQPDEGMRPYHNSGELEQEEPEWMNDGPTSQNECIELRGFDDDIPEEELKSRKNVDSEVVSNGFTVDKETGQLRREPVKEKVKVDVDKAAKTDNVGAGAKMSQPIESAVLDLENAVDGQLEKSATSNVGFGGRSRFMDLFGSKPAAVETGAAKAPSPKPVPKSPPPPPSAVPSTVFSKFLEQPMQAPPGKHQAFSPQEAGRGLLEMLQKSEAPPPAARPPPKPHAFQTLDDIESEHQQQRFSSPIGHQPPQTRQLTELQQRQQMFLQQQQQQHHQHHQLPDGLGSSRPSSIGSEPFGSPVPRSSSPLQQRMHPGVPRFMPPELGGGGGVPLIHIPDDPSLHKLLSFSHQELIHMRDTGHFDQGTLMTLIQMKSQKEAQAQHALRAAAALRHRAGLQGPPPFPVPISVPISGPHHGLPLPPQQQQQHHHQLMAQQMAAHAHNQMLAQQMRFSNLPQQLAHDEAVLRQIRQVQAGRESSPTQLAHELQMMGMSNPQLNQLSMEEFNRLEAARMTARQAQSQGPSPSNGQRPSPLLPTAVMRKTVQRGDSMTNILAGNQLHQSASSPQLLDAFQNHLQPQHQQQPLFRRPAEEDYQTQARNRMMAQRMEERQRALVMAQQQQQQLLGGGQFPQSMNEFAMQQQQQQQHIHGFSGFAHNLQQPQPEL